MLSRLRYRYWTHSTRTQEQSPRSISASQGGERENNAREVSILQDGAAIPAEPFIKPWDWYRPQQGDSIAITIFNSPRAGAVPRHGFMVPTFRTVFRTHRQATQRPSPLGRKMCVDEDVVAWKLCVPQELRETVLQENLDSTAAGHVGSLKTIGRKAA